MKKTLLLITLTVVASASITVKIEHYDMLPKLEKGKVLKTYRSSPILSVLTNCTVVHDQQGIVTCNSAR